MPGIIAGGVTQINIVIGSMIASWQDGAVSYLYYADRLYELPLAIVGIAIGVVLLPDVARHLRAGDHAAVMDSQNRSLEFAMLLTRAGGRGAGGHPVCHRRAYCSSAAPSRPPTRAATAAALAIFALGLPQLRAHQGVLAGLLRARGYANADALRDHQPEANTLGSIALFFLFRAYGLMPHLGIAVATTLGGWLNAWLL